LLYADLERLRDVTYIQKEQVSKIEKYNFETNVVNKDKYFEINVKGNTSAHGLSVVSCPESSILPNFLFFMPHVFPKLSYPFTRRKGLP
jgi:hypothetical protein